MHFNASQEVRDLARSQQFAKPHNSSGKSISRKMEKQHSPESFFFTVNVSLMGCYDFSISDLQQLSMHSPFHLILISFISSRHFMHSKFIEVFLSQTPSLCRSKGKSRGSLEGGGKRL